MPTSKREAVLGGPRPTSLREYLMLDIVMLALGAGFFVAGIASSFRVTVSSDPSTAGNQIDITVTAVDGAGGSGSLASSYSGTVNFYDGAALIGSGSLSTGVSGTTASVNTNLSVGSHSITAKYADDGNFNPSTSPALSQMVKDLDSDDPAVRMSGRALIFPGQLDLAPGAMMAFVEEKLQTHSLRIVFPASKAVIFGERKVLSVVARETFRHFKRIIGVVPQRM